MDLDLPLHPLIAHSSVVLVPAAAILLIIAVLFRPARRHVALVGVVAAVLGAISSYISMVSGENLSEIVGTPDDHARWGFYVVYSAAALAILGLVWFVLAPRGPARTDAVEGPSSRRRGRSGPAARVFGALTIVAAVAATVFMFLIGHSGAQQVWSDVEENGGPQGPESSSAAPDEDSGSADDGSADSGSADDGSADSGSGGGESAEGASAYSMAEVESNDSAESCWTAIDGTVYDLTDWIGQHPGGEDAIEGLCGTDGSERFNAQHGGSPQQEDTLSDYEIGELTGD